MIVITETTDCSVLGALKEKLIHFMQNFVFMKGCNKQSEISKEYYMPLMT